MLTQSPPREQSHTIETYFTPNASFIHPFCRTGSWEHSRFLIQAIYRWYKVLSPKIELTVHSVGMPTHFSPNPLIRGLNVDDPPAFDKKNLLLYVTLSQVFRIWFIPFHCAPVDLTSVLTLHHNQSDNKYYIAQQNDLYQTDQFIRFIPFLPGSSLFVLLWQVIATAFCVLGAICLWPLSFFQEVYSYKDDLKGIAWTGRGWNGEGESEEEGEVLEREMKSPSR